MYVQYVCIHQSCFGKNDIALDFTRFNLNFRKEISLEVVSILFIFLDQDNFLKKLYIPTFSMSNSFSDMCKMSECNAEVKISS